MHHIWNFAKLIHDNHFFSIHRNNTFLQYNYKLQLIYVAHEQAAAKLIAPETILRLRDNSYWIVESIAKTDLESKGEMHKGIMRFYFRSLGSTKLLHQIKLDPQEIQTPITKTTHKPWHY